MIIIAPAKPAGVARNRKAMEQSLNAKEIASPHQKRVARNPAEGGAMTSV
jgi:hypothetical protein